MGNANFVEVAFILYGVAARPQHNQTVILAQHVPECVLTFMLFLNEGCDVVKQLFNVNAKHYTYNIAFETLSSLKICCIFSVKFVTYNSMGHLESKFFKIIKIYIKVLVQDLPEFKW